MRTDRGFTLLEVLIAFAIAALALGVLFNGAVAGLRSTDTAVRYQEALARGRSHLAALAAPGRLAPSDRQGDDGGGYHWHERIVTVATLPPARDSQRGPADTGATLYAVRVAIAWRGDRGMREVHLDTERIGTGAAVRAP
jgi:general secretion pathway protein I